MNRIDKSVNFSKTIDPKMKIFKVNRKRRDGKTVYKVIYDRDHVCETTSLKSARSALSAHKKKSVKAAADFRKDLDALLKKHNARIGFSVSECSDTYGLSGECMTAMVGRHHFKLDDGWSY